MDKFNLDHFGFDFSSDWAVSLELFNNSQTSLEEKLEVYTDIVDSEVGDTPMLRVRNLERFTGIRQLFLKFEGGNPTGTHKDRIAFAQCLDALRRGFDTLSVATCGNYGVSIALSSKLAGLKCRVYIPEAYHTQRVKEMEELGAVITRTPGDYEKAVTISMEEAEKNDWYDANPGGKNTPIQLDAYGSIAYEIYDELRDAPKIVACPVSNGTLVAGIYKGFVSLFRRGKTSRVPLMVAGSSFKKNPIVEAHLKNKLSCEDLDPKFIKESMVNEPLINWHSFDGDLALDALRKTQGWAGNISDKKMLELSKMLKEKEGMNVLPASTAGLAALLQKHPTEKMVNDRFVVVLTGRKA
ncbi:pyridoxal-phosphate dependent enzyme [Rapidithrix thailandica]|uniref:Pyridoxal-phosphate dependent enzyme n=1 Tax=Rapidithrix thailandica TaxID=413964 RepID=A0AAW9S4K8_9BACT